MSNSKPRFIELDGVAYVSAHAIANSIIKESGLAVVGVTNGITWVASPSGELSVKGASIIKPVPRAKAQSQDPVQIVSNLLINIDDTQLKQAIADIERVSVKSIDDLASEVYQGLSGADRPETRWREAYRIAHIRASLRVQGGEQ